MGLEITTIGEVLEKIVGGGTPSKQRPDYWDGSIPWASVKDMADGQYKLANTKDSITIEGLNNSASNLIPSGNVIISTRMGLGRVYINKVDMAINQDLKALFPKKDVNNKYLLWYMASIANKIQAIGSGTTVKGIRVEQLKSLEFIKPPINTQNKIAAILSAYDDLIENNLRRIKILEEMAQNLYREWFVNFRFPGHENTRFVDSPLGKIPEGWEVKCLKDLLIFKNKGTKAGEHLNNLAYLPIDLLPRKSLAISEVKPWEEAKSSLHLFEEGDFLFGAMRPYFHKVAEAPFNGVTRKTCFVFASKNPQYRAFALLTLFQESTVAYANAHSKGATIPYAVWSNAMDNMQFAMPPEKYAVMFENTVGSMISRIKMTYHLNKNLRQTRDLLLPKLISGELDVSGIDIEIIEEVSA